MSPDSSVDLGNLPDINVTVSEFVDLLNDTYNFAFPSIVITGELANLRVSKNRWVYFDLKDDVSSVKFFATVQHLPGPLENGMLLHVRGAPRMHELYGFSVNVQYIQPAGEGSIRRAAQLLAAQLKAEGLFDDTRKRPVPYPPQRIGLITSAQSAAYADFIKIINARWGGLSIELIDVQVQGEPAPAQIAAAVERFNMLAEPPDVLVMIRGGGSADDLAAWSTELVVRAIAGSRVPTLVAIGHEVDTSLGELAADRRASTPSNAAELLTPDKNDVLRAASLARGKLHSSIVELIGAAREDTVQLADMLDESMQGLLHEQQSSLHTATQLLEVLSPHAALKRGYAVVRDMQGRNISYTAKDTAATPELAVGDTVHIELERTVLAATVKGMESKQHKMSPDIMKS